MVWLLVLTLLCWCHDALFFLVFQCFYCTQLRSHQEHWKIKHFIYYSSVCYREVALPAYLPKVEMTGDGHRIGQRPSHRLSMVMEKPPQALYVRKLLHSHDACLEQCGHARDFMPHVLHDTFSTSCPMALGQVQRLRFQCFSQSCTLGC